MPGDGAATLRVQARVVREPDGFTLDVDFEAPPGVTVLFGPSGSGKSTTLAAIAGLERPASGRITLGKDVWFDRSERIDVPVHRRRVAFVFQSLALFPHMSALANVGYGMDPSLDRDARDERARTLLDRLRAGHLADRRPATFSGGEAQRVALARALATSPRLILLDEPFSALDRELRVELIADLRDLVRELEVPVLFVTHHRAEARALGERVVMLEKGRVERVGSVNDLVAPGGRDMTFDETPLDPDGMLPR
jgi:molybdate transport system ATP-binding protein